MSGYIVKFGGSCLRDGVDLVPILQAVRSYRDAPVIVVSAFYGVTDRLEAHCGHAADAYDSKETITALRERAHAFLETASDLATDRSDRRITAALDEVDTLLEELGAELARNGKSTCGSDAASRSRILAFGERVAAATTANALSIAGVSARVVTPEESGLIATGDYDDATIDLDASRKSVRSAMTREACAVVPGYFAIRSDGEVALLGRGGSDYTATALGALLESKAVDLWKRGAGFRTADPDLVGGTRLVAALSYDEAVTAATHGSRILHPRCIEPLRTSEVSLRLFELGREEPRTLIGPHVTPRPAGPAALGYRDDAARGESTLALVGRRCDDPEIVRQRMIEALRGTGIACRPVEKETGALSMPTLTVSLRDRDAALEILHAEFFGTLDAQRSDDLSPRETEP